MTDLQARVSGATRQISQYKGETIEDNLWVRMLLEAMHSAKTYNGMVKNLVKADQEFKKLYTKERATAAIQKLTAFLQIHFPEGPLA